MVSTHAAILPPIAQHDCSAYNIALFPGGELTQQQHLLRSNKKQREELFTIDHTSTLVLS